MKSGLLILVMMLLGAACSSQHLRVAPDLPWSARIADSFLLRHPGGVTYDTGFTETKWNYEQGLMLWALYRMYEHSGDEKYAAFIRENLMQYIEPDGRIKTYKRTDYNIDLVAPGRALLVANDLTGDIRFRYAADTLRQQLREHPRTQEGGFWHKKIYPNQMWLDGLYMGAPFYAMYARTFGEHEAFDDIANQFIWIAHHTRDSATGLYYHAWDESRQMQWADKNTGRSPSFWGRAMGWYAMALVDVLEYFPETHPKRDELIEILRDVASGLLRWRDSKSHLWYLVLDQGERDGNYLESSSACMFTYAFARGSSEGYLPNQFRIEAMRSFDAILRHHVEIDQNGFVNLHNTIKGAGLGGRPYRDGTFAYYISEAQRTNDIKGVGPFLLAAVALERAGKER